MGGDGGGVQHAIEGGAADAEQLGSTQFVTAAARENIEDMLLDDLVQTLDVAGGGASMADWFDQGEQMVRLDDSTLGQSGGLGDDTFHLAKIVGPESLLELGQSRFVEHLGGVAGAFSETTQEPCGEDGDVFDALAQRRNKDFDRGETCI